MTSLIKKIILCLLLIDFSQIYGFEIDYRDTTKILKQNLKEITTEIIFYYKNLTQKVVFNIAERKQLLQKLVHMFDQAKLDLNKGKEGISDPLEFRPFESPSEMIDRLINGLKFLRMNFEKTSQQTIATSLLVNDVHTKVRHLLESIPRNDSIGHHQLKFKNCSDALKEVGKNGVYILNNPDVGLKPYNAYCISLIENGPWQLVLRNMNPNYTFPTDWKSYKYGFGNLNQTFFIGLEPLHKILSTQTHELLIQLKYYKDDKTRYARYDKFFIDNEASDYTLSVIGEQIPFQDGVTNKKLDEDLFSKHVGYRFSTFDNYHGTERMNCVHEYGSGWWYLDNGRSCGQVFLFGEKDKLKLDDSWLIINMAVRPIQKSIKTA